LHRLTLRRPATLRRVPPTRPQIHLPWPLGKEPRGSMAKAAASSPLEDLDLSGEEVQQLTSAFQDPEFRRMFSEYAEEITDPENRRRYEEEITALERERGVEVRFVHPEPGHWSLPYSLAPGREYAGGRGSRYTVYDVVFHPDALALARRHERFRQMLDATALEAGSPARPDGEPESPLPDFPYPYRYPEAAGSAAIPRPQAPSPPEAELVVTIELPLLRSAEQAALEVTGKLLGQERSTAGIREEPPPGAGNSPGDGGGGAPSTSSGDLDRGSSAGRCNQDEESLTLLIQVPRIQPQSLQGEVTPLWYKLSFSTQDLVYYSFFLQFTPGNKLNTKEPVVSISSNNAVIELAKSPECHGQWREWYYGLNNDSLEERLFVSEENVNEFLEEVLSPPFKQIMPLTPPLIEVLQVTDSKIEIHAKLQECSNSEQLHEKEERVNEGSHLTEKESLEHATTSADSNSSVAVKVLETDSCGSVACMQQGALDVSQKPFAKSQQPESKMEPEFTKDESAVHSNDEKDNLKEPVITEEKELDGDHPSSLLNKTAVHNTPGFDNIKETNKQDGSVQIIKDHVTHCSFSFQNSLLYDLD
ncbi:hypothetical protein E2I00_016823, partial [Balaenoptera physalus]